MQGELKASGEGSPSGSLFLRALIFVVAAGTFALFFAVAPAGIPGESTGATERMTAGVQGGADVQPYTESPLRTGGPVSARVASLFDGPSEDYEVIGTLGAYAPLEIVGRSEDGAWLAITLSPGSPFYVWLRLKDVTNAPAVSALPVKPPLVVSAP